MLVPCFTYILENCKKKKDAAPQGAGGGGLGGGVLRISSDGDDRMAAKNGNLRKPLSLRIRIPK